jgi:hypothetical protein
MSLSSLSIRLDKRELIIAKTVLILLKPVGIQQGNCPSWVHRGRNWLSVSLLPCSCYFIQQMQDQRFRSGLGWLCVIPCTLFHLPTWERRSYSRAPPSAISVHLLTLHSSRVHLGSKDPASNTAKFARCLHRKLAAFLGKTQARSLCQVFPPNLLAPNWIAKTPQMSTLL